MYKNKVIKIFLNLSVILLLFYLAIFHLDLNKLAILLKSINLTYLFFSLIISLIFPIIQSKKWQIITINKNKTTFVKSLETIIFGHVGSTLSGISLMNEVVKYFRFKKGVNFFDKIKFIILDKFLSIYTKFFLFNIFLILFFPMNYFGIYNDIVYKVALVILFLFSIVGVYIFFKYFLIFLLTIINNILIVSTYYLISLSLGINLENIIYFYFLIIELITQVFSMWGSRELISIILLQFVSLDKETSITFGLMFTFINLIVLIFYFILLSRNKDKFKNEKIN